MGMTVNARELEHIVRRLSAHHLAEVRMIALKLLDLALGAAPSLFLFFEPTAMDAFAHSMCPVESSPEIEVQMVHCDDDAKIGSVLIQRRTGVPLAAALQMWSSMGDPEKIDLFLEALCGLGIHDAPPRQWEFFQAEFEIILSASAYAQLKRHRICTRLVSVYDPILGVTMPESISDAGLEEVFRDAIRVSEKASGELGDLYPYLLTNAHRRRVLLKMNGRELYHFSRLREDIHAQWDIRRIAGTMMNALRHTAPLTFVHAGGKSELEGTLN
jgi:thymidylate synthase ThyX